jgi:TonB family protein
MKYFLFALLILCLVTINFAQEKTAAKQYEFKGVVRDKNSTVFAGVPLFFKSEGGEKYVSTNINGEFVIQLSPGNYEVTVRKTLSENFKAYIVIKENALNPNNVEFIIENNPPCCASSDGKPYSPIVKLSTPLYPAAARAVHATGEVIVGVKIDQEGKVISTQVVSGHPLLRKAAELAATKFLFAAAESDEAREADLTFVFLLPPNGTESFKRYSNPYRIEIVGKSERIEYTVDR